MCLSQWPDRGRQAAPVRLYAPTRHFFTSQSRRVAEPSYPVVRGRVHSCRGAEPVAKIAAAGSATQPGVHDPKRHKCQTFALSAALRGIMFSAINGNLEDSRSDYKQAYSILVAIKTPCLVIMITRICFFINLARNYISR